MRALRAAIHDKQFAPAYYLYGDDDYLKEDALRQLVDAAVDPATRDFNLDQRRGGELSAESLASLLAMPPMMAERRVVVIRDVPGLLKDARAALEQHLRKPSPDVLVVLSSAADSKTDKTLSELTEAVECKPLTGVQVPKWIVARVERDGGTISAGAVALLQNAVGVDLHQLALEVEKLLAFCAGRPIDEEAVSAVVGIRKDETLGELLDAVLARDSNTALQLLPGVLQSPKNNGVTMTMALGTQTLALAIARARGIPAARLSSEFYTLLKSAGSTFTGRAWGEAVSSWSRHAVKWSVADLDHALEVLLATDLALKSSRVSSEEQVLARAILAICAGVEHTNAA